ncbi:hypothetical protein RDV84_13025 [Lysobacter yananisis]|uniref:Lipoprotein n=1 Tax=Lysobacter yananisis TaxID=1003114 RepID=A0ABY9PF99_9GAMM|nr:hypothetical protein [Lysobacter yananisis]WMT05722.1 hypothetical protein RDV84_13025 [Lysobacter yananisis]
MGETFSDAGGGVKNYMATCCAIAISASLVGCVTGGRPERIVKSTDVFPQKVVEEAFKELAAVDASTESPPEKRATRDRNTIKLLAAIDLRYTEYKPRLLEQSQQVSIFRDMGTLMMTIAGALTESAGVKQNYLQGIALTTGAADIYNERVMFKLTAGAIVAQMDASRKAKLADIYDSLEFPIEQFPAMAALNAVLDYYEAGTLQGAVAAMQANAKDQQSTADNRLRANRDKRLRNLQQLDQGPAPPSN